MGRCSREICCRTSQSRKACAACWQLTCMPPASGRQSTGPAALLAAQTHATGLQEVSVGAGDGGRPPGDAVCRAGGPAGGHRCPFALHTKCFCSLLYIALHVRFCSQRLAECTGASAAGLRPYICEMWCSAMQEPAHGLLCLWGPALCHMLSQQRVAGGLAQLQVVTCSMLLCLWGQSFRSCAAAAGCHSRCSPQERKADDALGS